MARPEVRANPKAVAILQDLEQYHDFCRDYGYKFDERDLYNWRSYSYQQFNKFLQGKNAKDMWTIDQRRFS